MNKKLVWKRCHICLSNSWTWWSLSEATFKCNIRRTTMAGKMQKKRICSTKRSLEMRSKPCIIQNITIKSHIILYSKTKYTSKQACRYITKQSLSLLQQLNMAEKRGINIFDYAPMLTHIFKPLERLLWLSNDTHHKTTGASYVGALTNCGSKICSLT